MFCKNLAWTPKVMNTEAEKPWAREGLERKRPKASKLADKLYHSAFLGFSNDALKFNTGVRWVGGIWGLYKINIL